MFTWVLVTLTLIIFFYWSQKPSGLPPGRWGLPVIGYYPIYTKDITKLIKDMKEAFGNIFTWKLGSIKMVILCDSKVIKNVFSMPECQGRPYSYARYIYNYSSFLGIVRSNGYKWQGERRFALRHLRDLGLGKTSMESIIQDEAILLAKSYEDTAGEPTDFSLNVNTAVLNVLWKLVANRRYDQDSPELQKYHRLHSESLRILQGPIALMDVFPFLQYFVSIPIVKRWMKIDDLRNNINEFKDFFTELIREHRATIDPKNPRDYIDAYLKEIESEKGDPDTIFTDDSLNLVASVTSFFRAGSETISSTLRWMVALLATHPEVLQKVQREIDEVLPKNQMPSSQDKERMPYTEAMLFEVMRVSSLIPLGLPHVNTEDISVYGYHIPKGTILYACAESCHKDPKYWERPHEFYPEHFLDSEGKVITKKEGFLPFSLGRRQCLGENLAKIELFIFATCLLQRLSISPPEGEPIKTEANRANFLFHPIKPYKVVFTKRNA